MRSINLKSISTFWKYFAGLSLAVLLLSAHIAQSATIFPAGSLLQPNDVTTSHIRDLTITNTDVSTSAGIDPLKIKGGDVNGFLFMSGGGRLATSSSLKFASTTGDLYCFSCKVHATSTNFNGVSYAWPSSDGGNGQALTTNGSGTLTWTSANASQLTATSTAGEALTAGQSVFIATSSSFTTQQYISNSATNNDQNQACGKTTTTGSQGTKCAQKVTTVGAIGVDRVIVYLSKQGTPTDNVVVSIQADSAGVPSGTALAQGTLSGASLTTSGASYTVTLNSRITLSATTDYWVVIDRDGATNDTNYYEPTAGIYTGTTFYIRSSGGTWALDTDMKTYHIELYDGAVAGYVYATSANTTAKYLGFVGFTTSSCSSGASCTYVISGVATGLSGLTAGEAYYLSNTSGAISTTPGSVTRKVGIAVSTTAILVTNNW